MVKMRAILPLFLLLCIAACEKPVEVSARDYPFILSMEADDFEEGRINLSAYLAPEHAEQVVRYGFRWETRSGSEEQQEKSWSGYPGSEVNHFFNHIIDGGLKASVWYVAQAFAETPDLTILGPKIFFYVNTNGPVPDVFDYYPKMGSQGTRVRILGEHFGLGPTINRVQIGSAEAEVLSYNETELIIRVPALPRDTLVDLNITTPSGTRVLKDAFQYQYPWQQAGIYQEDLVNACGFSLLDEALIIPAQSNELLRYNPVQGNLILQSSLPLASGDWPLGVSYNAEDALVVLQNQLYYYSRKNNRWQFLSQTPLARSSSDYLFAQGGIIYYGSTLSNQAWQASLSKPSAWTPISAPPFLQSILGSAQIKDTLYLASASGALYRKPLGLPQADWQQVSSYPYSELNNSLFTAVGGRLVVGLGAQGQSDHQQMWSFREDRQWESLQAAPSGMQLALSFAYQGQVLLFTQKVMGSPAREIWSFSPPR